MAPKVPPDIEAPLHPAGAERLRLLEPSSVPVPPWRRWGPYVAERSWGTVREDYSPDGQAWEFLTHDMARSRAYRWGEDAIAGLCDRYQLLVFGFAFWNGHDPILKERMFGLTNGEGNHGEDVKEYWFYLDNTPTHSYMRMLYKYPQREFPYSQLLEGNRTSPDGFEYELLDTGIFDEDRYFDICIEYAKVSPDDICIRLEAFNRGKESVVLDCIPQLWFRNTWAWKETIESKPQITLVDDPEYVRLLTEDPRSTPLPNLQFPYTLDSMLLKGPAGGEPMFTNNESHDSSSISGVPAGQQGFYKDGFHRHIVRGEQSVNPEHMGTKAGIRYREAVDPGASFVLRLRLSRADNEGGLGQVDEVIKQRHTEADEFYESIHPTHATEEEKDIQRRALAGMLWSKQIYLFDVDKWISAGAELRTSSRNSHWRHLNSMRILAVPDRWEYPWFAAWDLAFECVTLALVDPAFAKENLWVLLFEQFQHPNGQIPAYEWEFSDLNPPVHAWACWRVYEIEKEQTGRGDLQFLKKILHKLLINFAWWVNRVDRQGNNVFEGGFLGLDNITVVDRSTKFADGVFLEQSDATGWMAFFCLNLMKIALELAKSDSAYEVLATKFFEHFLYISAAMKKMGGRDYQLWDQQDGFFYDVLKYPNGDFHKFRLRSLVGLIPLYAIEVLRASELEQHKVFLSDVEWFLQNRRDLVGESCCSVDDGGSRHYVLSVVDRQQLAGVLARLLDPAEFLSPAGLRSLSKFHKEHPFRFGDVCLQYEPAESKSKIKGGNSNWRGPVWFPTTYLLIESLCRFTQAFGSEFAVAPPHGGDAVTPQSLARELAERLISIFKRDERGFRPCYGGTLKFQQDPHWRNHLLFHEYFNGDDGAGLGASHQTGWTGLVANLIDEWRR